jgi:hypothetical protein
VACCFSEGPHEGSKQPHGGGSQQQVCYAPKCSGLHAHYTGMGNMLTLLRVLNGLQAYAPVGL